MESKHQIIRDLDGQPISVADLPDPNTVRWVARKKAIVVRLVQGGAITLAEILNRYHMTETEYRLWEAGLKDHGARGLQLTHFQKRRHARKMKF